MRGDWWLRHGAAVSSESAPITCQPLRTAQGAAETVRRAPIRAPNQGCSHFTPSLDMLLSANADGRVWAAADEEDHSVGFAVVTELG
jgi:hypothetical protein